VQREPMMQGFYTGGLIEIVFQTILSKKINFLIKIIFNVLMS
jgi:hypothetical protein